MQPADRLVSMDTITAIRTLRVVRRYADRPLTDDQLRAIADSARKTGSSKNTQRWDFVTVRDKVALARLSGVTIYAKHLPSAAAAIAMVVDKPNPDYPRSVLWDLGRAAQNITLAAWEMGIGSCPITVQDFELTMTTDFRGIDFPPNALSPVERTRTADGWTSSRLYP